MNERIELLQLKVLDGEATFAERVELDQFLDAHPSERALFTGMLEDARQMTADARVAPAPPALHAGAMARVSRAIIAPARLPVWRIGFVMVCGVTLLASLGLALIRILPPVVWDAQWQTVMVTMLAVLEGPLQVMSALGQMLSKLARIAARQPLTYLALAAGGMLMLGWAGAVRRAWRMTAT